MHSAGLSSTPCSPALLAALAAVMADQVPSGKRGVVSGITATSLPVAPVVGTFLVHLFDQNLLAMLLVPCAVACP